MGINNTFRYTYSAERNKEIESIRQKYLPKEESKLEQLKRLDNTVTTAGTTVSLVLGLLGGMLFGGGLYLNLWGNVQFLLPGILLGIVGILAMAAAYPTLRIIRRKKREELVPRILALTDELMKG